jgi:small GTP-binding protein
LKIQGNDRQKMDDLEDEAKFKVILLGDTSVGKTSIARRHTYDRFEFKMASTPGIDHVMSRCRVGNRTVKLMLYDTAGQEQFASLVPIYIRGADVCILVASIVDPDSCSHLERWHKRLTDADDTIPVVVAINKIDLVDGAPMPVDRVRDAYQDTFPDIFFVSARTGYLIPELFHHAVTLATGRAHEPSQPQQRPDGDARPGGCC